MREKPVRCFSSAAEQLKGPEGYFTSPAFSNARWSLAGEQRDERIRVFGRKLLRRLDDLGMPFAPVVGLMDLAQARHRYVTGLDPWSPAESPYLDGTAIQFAHCIHKELHPRSWLLFAEIAFDVARLAQIPVLWGGFAHPVMAGVFRTYEGVEPDNWRVDKRTYGVRKRAALEWVYEGVPLAQPPNL